MNKCQRVDCINYSNNFECGENFLECDGVSRFSAVDKNILTERFVECEEELQKVKQELAKQLDESEERECEIVSPHIKYGIYPSLDKVITYSCSLCKSELPEWYTKQNFCYNCGAKIKRGEK